MLNNMKCKTLEINRYYSSPNSVHQQTQQKQLFKMKVIKKRTNKLFTIWYNIRYERVTFPGRHFQPLMDRENGENRNECSKGDSPARHSIGKFLYTNPRFRKEAMVKAFGVRALSQLERGSNLHSWTRRFFEMTSRQLDWSPGSLCSDSSLSLITASVSQVKVRRAALRHCVLSRHHYVVHASSHDLRSLSQTILAWEQLRLLQRYVITLGRCQFTN